MKQRPTLCRLLFLFQDRFTGDGRFSGSLFTTASVKRTKEYTTHAAWTTADGWGDLDSNEASSGLPSNYDPNAAGYCRNWSCWVDSDSKNWNGTDYLDDVAYYLRHQDLFPDAVFGTDPVDGWPGDQNIFTYTIGFSIDNDLLRETAINGDGAYYTASSYQELVDAFQAVITGILLRNFAFSAITAPKKTATTTSDDLTVSYVGYFMPSQAASIWDGHLLAFELEDKWGFDVDGLDGVTVDEFDYDTEEACLALSGGKICERWLELATGHKWDAAEKLPDERQLYTYNVDTSQMLAFDDANKVWLQGKFGTTLEADTLNIINTIGGRNFADVFHSDVSYVGAPPEGKRYLKNINPLDEDGETYAEFYEDNKERRRVLFAGTNDGIFHMFNADDKLHVDEREAGAEVWGFIPDDILPSLKTIVLDHEHTYTVDGRIAADDIYYEKAAGTKPTWSTILSFGLRRGGNTYYTLDITKYANKPTFLWKFNDPVYSGESWGKPAIGKLLYIDPSDNATLLDKWVVVLPGGFAFNEEDTTDLKGKAVFIVDAATGELIWMVGYHPDGDTDLTDKKHLTDDELYNFPVSSALTLVDVDNNGYVDSIYFGNLGGHLFKVDLSNLDSTKWETKNLYKTEITTIATSDITAIAGTQITMRSARDFEVGHRIQGATSKARGYITAIDNKVLTVFTETEDEGRVFQDGEFLLVRSYDPIFLSPAVAYNNCYQLWIAFGTGDRDRPRTDPIGGHLVALRGDETTGNTLTNLSELIWDGNTLISSTLSTGLNGWYFEFPDAGEKLFDPEPLILPDETLTPHIFFNTFQPPEVVSNINKIDNPCTVPSEGSMMLYDIILAGCAPEEKVEGTRVTGRIAGGGIYQGQEYILYTSESGQVADVPGGDGKNFSTSSKRLNYPGGVVFWKEKKR